MVGRLGLSLDKDGSIAFDSTMTLRMTLQVAHHMLDCLAGNCVLDGGGRVFAFHPAHLINFISLNTFHFISDPVLNHHFPRIIKNKHQAHQIRQDEANLAPLLHPWVQGRTTNNPKFWSEKANVDDIRGTTTRLAIFPNISKRLSQTTSPMTRSRPSSIPDMRPKASWRRAPLPFWSGKPISIQTMRT